MAKRVRDGSALDVCESEGSDLRRHGEVLAHHCDEPRREKSAARDAHGNATDALRIQIQPQTCHFSDTQQMTSAEGSSDFDSFESIDNDDVDVDIDIDNDNDGRKTSLIASRCCPRSHGTRWIVVLAATSGGKCCKWRLWFFFDDAHFQTARPRPMATSSRHAPDSPHWPTKSYDQKKKNYLFHFHFFIVTQLQ
jgi:hypothetical protein